MLARDQVAQRTEGAAVVAVDLEVFVQASDVNERRHERRIILL
jgi:hypothetical protein